MPEPSGSISQVTLPDGRVRHHVAITDTNGHTVRLGFDDLPKAEAWMARAVQRLRDGVKNAFSQEDL